jgi:hypothetical protein
MPDKFKEPQKRAIQYFYVDGTFEFGFGLLSLILAGYFYVETHVSGWLTALVSASLLLVIICGGYLIKFMIGRLKERITWPRTGYVSYKNDTGMKRSWRMALGGIVGGVIAAALSVLVMDRNINIAVMPFVSGLLFGFVFSILGWRTSVPRFHLLGFLSAVLGVALSFSRLGNYPSMIWFYAGFAAILLFTGSCVLRTYLHQNPIQNESSDEH